MKEEMQQQVLQVKGHPRWHDYLVLEALHYGFLTHRGEPNPAKLIEYAVRQLAVQNEREEPPARSLLG